jgi:hypothetical protein
VNVKDGNTCDADHFYNTEEEIDRLIDPMSRTLTLEFPESGDRRRTRRAFTVAIVLNLGDSSSKVAGTSPVCSRRAATIVQPL